MITRQMIVDEALTWEGTPYAHQGRLKGIGCDCVGLVLGVLQNVGVFSPETLDALPKNYSPNWHLYSNEQVLLSYVEQLGGIEKHPLDMVPGDVLCLHYGQSTSHSAILLPKNKLIHALVELDKVVIQPITKDYRQRITKVYEVPGVT